MAVPARSNFSGALESMLELFEPPVLFRSIYARSLKYVLPRTHWDFAGPLLFHRAPHLRNHPNVLEMEEIFLSQAATWMESAELEARLVRDWSRFDRGLSKKRVSRRVRKKRLSMLTAEAKKEILRRGGTRRDIQGITYFGYTVGHQFLMGAAASRR